MNEWKVIFATVVIFGAGVVTGGLLVNYVDFKHGHPAHRPVPPVAVAYTNSASSPTNNLAKTGNLNRAHLPEVLSKQFVDKLDIDLQLTLDQRADIEKIIANGQDDMRRAYQESRLSAREKIRKLLTPPQVKKFDELLKSQQLRPLRRQPEPQSRPAEPTNAPASAPADAA